MIPVFRQGCALILISAVLSIGLPFVKEAPEWTPLTYGADAAEEASSAPKAKKKAPKKSKKRKRKKSKNLKSQAKLKTKTNGKLTRKRVPLPTAQIDRKSDEKISKLRLRTKVIIIRKKKKKASADKSMSSTGSIPDESEIDPKKAEAKKEDSDKTKTPTPEEEYELIGKVVGIYKQRKWTLISANRAEDESEGEADFSAVRMSKKSGKFSLIVPLSSERTELLFRAVDPNGKTENETVVIDYPQYEYALSGKKKKGRHNFGVSLGFSSVSFTEGSSVDYSMISPTLKLSYSYLFASKKWDIAANVYGNLFALSKSGSAATARFIGVNWRAGWTITNPANAWNFRLLAGWFLSTMMVSGSAFGYENTTGPQLFPMVTYRSPGGNFYYVYFKFSPLLNGFSLLSLSSREIATGIGWKWAQKSKTPFSVHLDISDMRLTISNTLLTTRTYSLSCNMGF